MGKKEDAMHVITPIALIAAGLVLLGFVLFNPFLSGTGIILIIGLFFLLIGFYRLFVRVGY